MSKNTVRIRYVGDADSLRRATRDAEGQLTLLGATGSKAFHALGKAALLGGAAVAGGLAIGLEKSVKSAIDFDREMRNVNSIARVSDKQFKTLSTSVLALSKDSGQAPKTLAQGLYDIVSSGFKANAGIKILRVSAKAATAGMTDTATATKAVVASLNAYHLSADQAANVGDVLFQTVNKGVLTFEELSQNIGDVLPSASTLGVPLEQIGGALATITLHGVNASEAATQVKQVMISMLKPSTDLAKQFKSMGFESGQAAIKQLGFAGVIKALSKAAGDNKTEIAKWFPNVRALGGFFGLAGKNLKTFTDNVDAMGVKGALVKAFAEQSKSISVQWQKAKTALIAASIPLGQLLFPALSKAAGAASSLAGYITRIVSAPSLAASLKVAAGGAKQFAAEVRTALSHALFTWKEVIPEFGGLHQVGEDSAVVFHQGLLSQLQSLNWGLIGKKIGTGISATITFTDKNVNRALGALLAWMNAHAQDFASVGANIAIHLVATLLDPGFWISHWKLLALIAFTVFGGELLRVFGTLARLVVVKFIGIFEPLFARIAPRAVGLFLDAFGSLPHALQRIAYAAGRAIYDSISSKVGALKAWFAKVPGWISAAFKVSAVLAVVGAIQSVIDKVKDLWNWLKKLVDRGWDIAVHIHVPGSGVVSGIKNVINTAFPNAGGLIPKNFPGSTPGVDSVPALLTPGEVVFNPDRPAAGLKALMDLGFERPAHFAGGGRVKTKHRAPRLPASIREAEARAAGTKTLDDDLAALKKEEHWIEQELRRSDLTASERENLRVRLIRIRNRIRSLNARRQKAAVHDYSVLPPKLQYAISKSHLTDTPADDIEALKAAERYLVKQLGRKGLSYAQKTQITDALVSVRSELSSLAGQADASGDLQAQLDQANARLAAATYGYGLDEAFIASGGVNGGSSGGGGGGGESGERSGGSGQTVIFQSAWPPSSDTIREVTRGVARGAGTQPHRTRTQELLGL